MSSLEYLKNNSLIRKFPSFRNDFVNGCWRWIEGKKKDDNAAGLWRVHDKLYDLTDFIPKHPGGRAWLEISKVNKVFKYQNKIGRKLLKT